jgi:hypothetical protein
MSTRSIQTAREQVSCDVCGRSLLRGERSETFLAGGTRRSVCDLCTARASQEGWIPESARLDEPQRAQEGRRRGALLGRLRQRRDELGRAASTRVSDAVRLKRDAAQPAPARQVHAVPTSPEHQMEAAVEVFNASECARTVGGIGRSLGPPGVVVRPLEHSRSAVGILAAWELCWYRWEVELSESPPQVRAVGQGHELSELGNADQVANAAADEDGRLTLVLDPVAAGYETDGGGDPQTTYET